MHKTGQTTISKVLCRNAKHLKMPPRK